MSTMTRPHSFSLRLCALAFAAFGAVAACEADPKTTTGSGLPKDKALSSLTDSERTAFCGSNSKALAAGVPADLGCRLFGALAALGANTDAEVKSMCQAAYDACVKMPPMPSSTPSTPAQCSVPATCTATVGEADACLQENIALFKMLPSCQELKKSDIDTMPGADPEPGPACKALDTKCKGAKLGGS